MGISLILLLGWNVGCKKEEKTTLTNQTVGQIVNQTINKTAEKIINQTQVVKQTLEQKTEKVVNQTQTITFSCLKCHGSSEKLSQSIKNAKVTSAQELVKYLKTTSPHKNLHKNLKDEEIIKAFESFTKSPSPKKKIEGC